MSEAGLALPAHLRAEQDKINKPKLDSGPSQLPEPKGYKLLIMLPEAEKETKGGILKADATLQQEEVASICGFVVSMGPDAYADKKRFPNGPYCKQGDWILMRAFSGTRFAIHGREMRLINDDGVEAVIDDPRGVRKL